MILFEFVLPTPQPLKECIASEHVSPLPRRSVVEPLISLAIAP
jgi:hypothetical protein